jgi:hypothetical protein
LAKFILHSASTAASMQTSLLPGFLNPDSKENFLMQLI